jgi:hypothetical protein
MITNDIRSLSLKQLACTNPQINPSKRRINIMLIIVERKVEENL